MNAAVLVWAAWEFELAPSLEAAWLQGLPPERQAALAVVAAAARRRSLFATRLLAMALQALGFTRQPLSSLRYLPNGRPTLALPVELSISHSGGCVLCAASTAGPVGVDVEAVTHITATEFQHYLSADERAWAGNDPARFASVWTRKEAVVKAAGGVGLRDVPRVVTRSGADTVAMLDGQVWRTLPLPLGSRHVAHLAVQAAAGEPDWQLIEPPRDQLEG